MQCKDIPDRPILEMLARNYGQWCFWYPDWPDPDRCLASAMPPGTPEKLMLAKMKQMVRRGVAEGCTCGCRGDFEITDKGLAELKSALRAQWLATADVLEKWKFQRWWEALDSLTRR